MRRAFSTPYVRWEQAEKKSRFSSESVVCVLTAKSKERKVDPLHINIYKERMLEAELLNHAGTVLSPAALKRDSTQARPIKDRFLLTRRKLSLAEFCQEHGLLQVSGPRKFIPRPASPEEAGLFYALPPERDEELGAIGLVRMDFGHGGEIKGGICCQNHGFVDNKQSPPQEGNVKRCTIDELLAPMEPVYRQQKAAAEKCVAGLTVYAAGCGRLAETLKGQWQAEAAQAQQAGPPAQNNMEMGGMS